MVLKQTTKGDMKKEALEGDRLAPESYKQGLEGLRVSRPQRHHVHLDVHLCCGYSVSS